MRKPGKRLIALLCALITLWAAPVYGVSIAWITDTQNYYGSYGPVFYQMTQWIADNKERLDIQYLFHSGDIVGSPKAFSQWEEAQKALGLISDAEIPMLITSGNHDVGSKVTYQWYMDYISSTQTVAMDTEYGETGSRYVLFEEGGRKYIFMAIAFSNKGPSDEEAEWIVNALNEYSDRYAIIVTHSYIKLKGDLTTQGNAIYNKIIKNCPNVFLVLCGHCRGVNVKKQTTPDGREVTAILANFQSVKTGHLRMLSFRGDSIYVYTYSPVQDTFDYKDPSKDRLYVKLPVLDAE